MQQTIKNLVTFLEETPLYIDDPESNNVLVFDMSLIDLEKAHIFFKVALDEWDNLFVSKAWIDSKFGKLFIIKESPALGNANKVLDFLDNHICVNASVYERKTFFATLSDLKELASS